MSRRKEFYKELSELLKKHNATIEADDEYTGHPGCGEDIQIIFDIEGVYDKDPKHGNYVDFEDLEKLI